MLHEDVELVVPMDWSVPQFRSGRPLAELAIHYFEFASELDDSELVALCRDWVEQNGVPRGRWWGTSWNSYGLSLRCVHWMQELAARPDLPADGVATIAGEVAVQIRFLVKNLELDLGGNHLLKNIRALLWAAAFFDGEEALGWRELGARLLERELSEQVLDDGMHYERSPAYHALVLGDFLDCYQVLPEGSVRDRLGDRLDSMAQVLVDFVHPDGGVSLFNDAGLEMADPPELYLEHYHALRKIRPTPRPAFDLPLAGYFGLRSDDELLLIDCGPIAPDHLPAHGHGDILAFEWSVGGRRIAVDFGVFEYNEGEWRARSRATASHNTVTVDGADQCEFWGSFRVGRRARVHDVEVMLQSGQMSVTGAHDGFRFLRGRPIHRRRFSVEPGQIAIRDDVLGGAGQLVEARILLHPDVVVSRHASGVQMEAGQVRISVETDGELSVCDHFWCPNWGERYDTRQLVISYGNAPASGAIRMRRLDGVP